MPDRKKIISEFERWCDEMEDECPVICLHALALLKEQGERIKELELEKGWDESHDMMGKW